MSIVDDKMKEDSVYSLLVDSLNSNLNEEPISLKDVAWADSCLNKDMDSINTNWSFVQEALLEILSSQPAEGNSTADESSMPPPYEKNLPYGTNIESLAYGEILRSGTDIENLEFSTGHDDYEDVDDEDNSIGEDEIMETLSENDEGELMVRRKRRVRNIFRANYTEDVVVSSENSGSELDMSLTTNEMEPLSENLFKVWDLDIVNEEDEFSKELSKALKETPPVVESSVDDSTLPKNFVNVSLDDLIADLGDLSLEQFTTK